MQVPYVLLQLDNLPRQRSIIVAITVADQHLILCGGVCDNLSGLWIEVEAAIIQLPYNRYAIHHIIAAMTIWTAK